MVQTTQLLGTGEKDTCLSPISATHGGRQVHISVWLIFGSKSWWKLRSGLDTMAHSTGNIGLYSVHLITCNVSIYDFCKKKKNPSIVDRLNWISSSKLEPLIYEVNKERIQVIIKPAANQKTNLAPISDTVKQMSRTVIHGLNRTYKYW